MKLGDFDKSYMYIVGESGKCKFTLTFADGEIGTFSWYSRYDLSQSFQTKLLMVVGLLLCRWAKISPNLPTVVLQ